MSRRCPMSMIVHMCQCACMRITFFTVLPELYDTRVRHRSRVSFAAVIIKIMSPVRRQPSISGSRSPAVAETCSGRPVVSFSTNDVTRESCKLGVQVCLSQTVEGVRL